jgi:hypothetical protein
MPDRPRRIWIDLTNSPHVVFFRPILRRLDEAGVESVVTARDFAQTLGLLERFGIPHTVIGRHGGATLRGKGLGLVRRSTALLRFGRGRGITQAVSHGSNDLAVAARLLRLHSTVLHDYEGAAGMHRINFRQRGSARRRATKSQNPGCTVGSPPSSCTSNAPSAGRLAASCSQVIQVRPAGDDHVLHHGQARLQWFVNAT